jgi:hypothetical protein
MHKPQMKKKYQDATMVQTSWAKASSRHGTYAQFFRPFDQFAAALPNLDIASEPVLQGDGTTRLRVITPFGNLYATAYTFDGWIAGAAMLFYR